MSEITKGGRNKSDAAKFRNEKGDYVRIKDRGFKPLNTENTFVGKLEIETQGEKYRCVDCGAYYSTTKNHVCKIEGDI